MSSLLGHWPRCCTATVHAHGDDMPEGTLLRCPDCRRALTHWGGSWTDYAPTRPVRLRGLRMKQPCRTLPIEQSCEGCGAWRRHEGNETGDCASTGEERDAGQWCEEWRER
jgi:hypothetical protein